MTTWDDYLDMQDVQAEAYEEYVWELISEGVWETKEHDQIAIADMESSHIKNTIRMLQRNTPESAAAQKYIEIMNTELKRRI